MHLDSAANSTSAVILTTHTPQIAHASAGDSLLPSTNVHLPLPYGVAICCRLPQISNICYAVQLTYSSMYIYGLLTSKRLLDVTTECGIYP